MNLDTIDFSEIAQREDSAHELRELCYRKLLNEMPRPLLSESAAITKIRKSETEQYKIVSLALAHALTSGHQVCAGAVPGCIDSCVGGDSVGLGSVFPQIMAGRIRKTQFLFADRRRFLLQLIGELERSHRSSHRSGAKLCSRLNCYSDLPWEAWGIPQLFKDCQFYDYSALIRRVLSPHRPANYSLCFSYKGTPQNIQDCFEVLSSGWNVAIPFAQRGSFTGPFAYIQQLPERWRILGLDVSVIDGDTTDLRHTDPGPDARGLGRIIGLRFKIANLQAREKALKSGFVVVTD
jgi:hypothetical protein